MKLPAMPIRFKILLALLVVVTTVVSAITFTMAGLFHQDKKLYVSDLASVMALHAAQEADVLTDAYRDRLETYAAIVDAPGLAASEKTATLRNLIALFPELIAIRVDESGAELLTLFDDAALEQAGLTREALLPALTANSAAGDPADVSGVRVANSTVSPKLPTLSATILHQRSNNRPPLAMTAVIRLGELQRIARRSAALNIFLADANGILLAAHDPALPARRERARSLPELGPGSAAVVLEYDSPHGTMIGGFARARIGGVAAGAELPRAAAYFASRMLLQRLLIVALVLLVLAALVGTFWARRITRSIASLAEASRAIGRGRFDVSVREATRDEIGALAASFNQMASELQARERALKTAQAALIQSEKMAAFGQLGAGIAHEVKNPLAGIQGIVQLALRQSDEKHPLREPLTIIEKEAKRCRTIIDNLLKFARQDKVAHVPTDIAPVVTDSAAIMRHQLALHQVKIESEIEPGLPMVQGSANQLQQVLMNLVLNAEQAFEGRAGLVRLQVGRTPDGWVRIQVLDNGPGIPEEIRERIFEPFFTTKPAGQGTGLGLSVSFGIIKDHGGRIEVESAPDQGTTFTITLPPAAAGEMAKAA
jgi:signal transduction histidine kinase